MSTSVRNKFIYHLESNLDLFYEPISKLVNLKDKNTNSYMDPSLKWANLKRSYVCQICDTIHI